ISLRSLGIEGGEVLEAMVYLVILVTGVWATVMAVVLPRAFGYMEDPSRRRAILVGANPLTRQLANLFLEQGRGVAVVDAVPWRLDPFRDAGFFCVVGDARDTTSYEEANVDRDSWVIAGTTNDDLNLLVAELVHSEFGVEHPVLALQSPPDDFGVRTRGWAELLGGQGVDIAAWNGRIVSGNAEVMKVDLEKESSYTLVKDLYRRWPEQAMVLCGWVGDDISFEVTGNKVRELDAVSLLVVPGDARDYLEAAAARSRVDTTAESAKENGETDVATVSS
ncbi:MAG: NAD-binding protein, partial [Thermoanaerobaculia bacterium]|nr:NAD-binding protein [Thermoanaerobaculia bacterium]